MYIERRLGEVIGRNLFKGKVIVLYGPRQSGKTTLVKHLMEPYGGGVRYIDCELVEYRDLLERRSSADLLSLVRGYKIVVFDEAQVVPDIGQVLKTLVDHAPEVQYIATGSSSFDLANIVSEPLTGRSLEYTLYPLGLHELAHTDFDVEQSLPGAMRFGLYPGVQGTEEEKVKSLNTLVSQYLYKNVLAYGGVRKPDILSKLLKLLAHQIGQEVSFRELAGALAVSQQTVENYIDLLEKNFIITRLSGYARNLRSEVTRKKKIYFLDLGVRNVLIGALQPIDTASRADIGGLFENAAVIERLKYLSHTDVQLVNRYFWSTFTQQEVDYIEEKAEALDAYEFKWSDRAKGAPRSFRAAYPAASFLGVTPRTLYSFITS